MTDDPRVDQLLEELLESGGTPEEVCLACPGLRDPGALEKLPPAERQECSQLWTDLDVLLKRAQAPK